MKTLIMLVARVAYAAATLGVVCILFTGGINLMSGENVIPNTLAYFGFALGGAGITILLICRAFMPRMTPPERKPFDAKR